MDSPAFSLKFSRHTTIYLSVQLGKKMRYFFSGLAAGAASLAPFSAFGAAAPSAPPSAGTAPVAAATSSGVGALAVSSTLVGGEQLAIISPGSAKILTLLSTFRSETCKD